MSAVSPLAPKAYPELPPIAGVRFATAEAGIKYKDRTDVLLMVLDKGTEVAGVFTRSKCPSAPVDWCKAALAKGTARALLVNSGNANAFTGKRGRETVKLSAGMVADALGCRPKEIFLASTGVIGEPLDPQKFAGVVVDMAKRAGPRPWLDAGRAIMTTDTFPKVATRLVDLGGATVTINGFAKGAGMIAPDMATMLAFVFTDAAIAAPALQAMLSSGVKDSFNAITVDSDTSTSDTLLLFATGQDRPACGECARPSPRSVPGGARLPPPRACACRSSATARGPGSSSRSRSRAPCRTRSARRIALSIANSPLVKTAIAGEDANWGRIVMAVGKAGETRRPRQARHLVRRHARGGQGRARPGLLRGRRSALHEARRDRHPRRPRPRQRTESRLDLRPDQGIRRDQR